MLQNDFLIRLFLYFAKFPVINGIAPLFNVGESAIEGYQELKTLINALPDHSITEIKHYIFGANFEAVRPRVNNIPSGQDYLFVDFGEIDCNRDRSNRMTDSTNIAVTVAYRMKSFSGDLIEQTLAFNHALEKISTIRNIMFQDQQCEPWLKKLSDTHQFLPFVSDQMNSIGWSMIFKREGYDTFGAK